jgi:hypothetical protein
MDSLQGLTQRVTSEGNGLYQDVLKDKNIRGHEKQNTSFNFQMISSRLCMAERLMVVNPGYSLCCPYSVASINTEDSKVSFFDVSSRPGKRKLSD